MRDGARFGYFAGTLLLALAACSDAPDDKAERADISGIEAALVPGDCELNSAISFGVRDFFNMPERQTANSLSTALDAACRNENRAGLAMHAWNLLAFMEATLEAGTASSSAPLAGAPLTNALLACTRSLCRADANPNLAIAHAFTATGMFAVRRDDMEAVIARGVIPFTDLDGNSNTALWGIEVTAPWSTVAKTNPVLVYGGEPAVDLVVAELSLGDMQYQLDVYPDMGEFPDNTLFVGICFGTPFDVPDDLEARVQREGVVLESHTPTFCPSSGPAAASIAGPLLGLLNRVMPAPVRSMLVRGATPNMGCGALDFSRFAGIAADPLGTLEFVLAPPANVKVGQAFDIKVLARSGAGTPTEKQQLVIEILNNRGTPAGAVLGGQTTTFTSESAGQQGIGVFSNVTVGKPGQYRICVKGVGGFQFDTLCGDLVIATK